MGWTGFESVEGEAAFERRVRGGGKGVFKGVFLRLGWLGEGDER